ncbi:MAG: hypothetical protein E3J70_02460 [Candidatus Heimdallarchaeota archaeon]|nr:MAG: hypothetical protein E3J70_02460 [Candidatus Heimdallarchaeota archaeon]
MEFESPLSPYKALKKTEKFFELKVNNSKIKDQPLTKKDPQFLQMSVATIFGEIFWMNIHTRRTKTKTTKVSLKSRPGTRHMFLSTIVLLMSGPFLYMAISSTTSTNIFTYIISVLFAVIGIASLIMPIFRINSTQRKLKEALSTEEQFEEEIEEKTKTATTSRLALD